MLLVSTYAIANSETKLSYSFHIPVEHVSSLEDRRLSVRDGLFAFLTVFVAGVVSFEFAREMSGSYAVWWPNGVLLAALLGSRRQVWPLLLLSGGLAILLAHAPLPEWQPRTLLLVAGCVIETGVAAWLIRWWAHGPFTLNTASQILRFIVIGVVLTPLISAVFAIGFLHTGDSAAATLLHWYFADALGVAMTAPVMLAAYRPRLRRHTGAMQSTGLLVALAAGGCICLFQPDMAILGLLFPLVIIVSVRMGWIVGALGVLTLSVIGSGLTAAGYGPFAALRQASVESRILELQIFLAALTASAAIVATVYEERVRLFHQAQEKERGVRLLTDSSPDLLLLSDLSSRVLYVSQAVAEMLGYRPAEVYRKSVQFDLMYPSEVAAYADALEAVRRQRESRTLIFRIRRKDGSSMWAEDCISLYRDEQTGEPIGFVNVVRDITHRKEAEDRLQSAYKELEVLAAIDSLTGVANRRHFDAVLDAEWKRAMRNGTEISILLIDVDFFKNFNDIYGHLKGDDCLRDIAATISGCTHRSTDMVARYGGEEFAVILPETDEAGAAALAERIRAMVQSHGVRHAGNAHRMVTISIGCSCMIPSRGSSCLPLIEAADKALYRAKDKGRNRVVRATLME